MDLAPPRSLVTVAMKLAVADLIKAVRAARSTPLAADQPDGDVRAAESP
jgi:hypothetical protein